MGSVTDKYLLLLFSTLLSLWNWFWYQHLPLYLFMLSFVIPRLLFEAGNFLALQWMNLELQQAACNVLINKRWDWWLIGLNIWHVTKASLIALWHTGQHQRRTLSGSELATLLHSGKLSFRVTKLEKKSVDSELLLTYFLSSCDLELF